MMSRFLNIDQLIYEVMPCYAKGTVYNLVSRREIPYIKKGGKLIFEVEAVERWLRESSHDVTTTFMETTPWER